MPENSRLNPAPNLTNLPAHLYLVLSCVGELSLWYCIGFRRGPALLLRRIVGWGVAPMSGEQNPLFSDPTLMRVNYQAATQPADGSPPRYGNAVAPHSTAFHTHAGGQAASYLRTLADAELTRNQQTPLPTVPQTPQPSQYPNTPMQQSSPPHQLPQQRDSTARYSSSICRLLVSVFNHRLQICYN